jgi:Ca2+-dependent lipid-binding protein
MAGKVAPMPTEEMEALKETTSTMSKDDDCDPYLKITIPSLRQTRETKHKTHDRNPDWNETLTFHGVTGRSELLDISVMVRACSAPRSMPRAS